MTKIKGIFRRVFNRLRGVNHKHYIALLLVVVSSALGVFRYSVSYERLVQSFIDLYRSCVYFFAKTFFKVEDKPVTVTQIQDIDLSKILPFDITGFKELCAGYFDRLFSADNFREYSMCVLLSCTLMFSIVPILIPVFMGIVSRIKAMYLCEGNIDDKNTDTPQLSFFKRFIEPVLYKATEWVKSFIAFLKEKNIYLKFLLVIWLLNLNIGSIIVTFLAFYFFIMSSYDVVTIPSFLLKLFLDIVIMFTGLPVVVWVGIVYVLILRSIKAVAYSILQHHEMKNRGFINAQPLGTLGCATMGAGKTSLSVDMALSASVMFKDKALEILIKSDMKFPNFPWLKFEDDLKQCYANHLQMQEDIKEKGLSLIDKTQCIYNLASSKYWVISKAQKFLENPCSDNLWGYNFERYRTEYDDDLKITDLFETLITYSKAYLIYITQCSLIFGNLSIREDMFCDDGYLPLWYTDFFHRSPADSMETSRFAKIIDFDMLRLGKKMCEDNQNSGAFEFGVVVLTEIGKERGNAKENREMKKKDEEANANNDGFEDTVKMIRHRATVDFFPFVRIISDEQRAESLGANTRDTFSVIQIVGKSELRVLYKGLFFDGFIHDILYPKFEAFYLKMRNLRGDNTLLVYLLKNIFAFTENRYTKLENRFGYYTLNFETTTGRLDNKPTETKYYLSRKKTYSDRFATDCYGDFFEKMALYSGIGIMDFLEYRDVQQSEDEMQLQNSYFYVKMSLYTQFADV